MKRQNKNDASGRPQKTLLFRVVSLFTKLRLGDRYFRCERPLGLVSLFVFCGGTVSLGTIAAMALLFEQPLLFPSLAPTAFLVFYTPMAPAASPRTVVFAHTTAVLCGIACIHLSGLLWPEVRLMETTELNWVRVFTIMVTMGVISGIMSVGRFAHPPAAASALLPVLGYMDSITDAAGLIGAAIMLAIEAFLFNRVIGGLPYPVWKTDPETVRKYGALAGLPSIDKGYSETLAQGIFRYKD